MATTENNKYKYEPEKYGENSFDILFGAPTREDIRVGYIDSRQGYITGRSICDANRHAKLNPGAQFIIKTRKRVRYLNVNEVNTITPEQAFDTSEEGMGIPEQKPECEIEFGSIPEEPRVDFMGGGGVGVKGNPVIGRDGSVLAIHIVDGGFGYKYAPLVDVKDPSQIGGGVVAQSFLGEISAGLETYNDESDIEEYFPTNAIDPKTGQPSGVNIKSFCDSKVDTDVSYGRVYSADGLDVAEWDPTLYSNFSIDPFRKRVEDYQKFLAQLKTPWWVSRRRGDVNTPLSVSASWDKTIPEYFYETRPGYTKGTTVYPVQHSKWGGYYKKDLEGTQQGGLATGSGSTNTDLEDIEFKFFVAVAKKYATGFRWVFRELKEEPNPKKPIYKGEDRYGPHRFIVSPDDMKSSTGGKGDLLSKNIDTIVKKVKVNTNYQIIGEGTTHGYGVEQGLVSKMRGSGTGLSGGHNTEIVGEDQTGTMIFSDLIYSENDDDDMQLGATAGLFTQKNRRPGAKGNKLPSTEMYEVNGKQVTTGIKKAISGGMGDIAYTNTKKVLDENGEWKDETTTIKEFGRDTYDLFYRVTPQELGLSKGNTKVPEDATGGKGEATAITQSFMNKYAISPIPPSNDRGSDYADQLFIMQWKQVFPYGGEYHFRGQTDNHCKFYLDNEFISDLSSFQNTPWEWKKEFSWKGSDDGQVTVKNIRLELRNDSDLESIIVQQDDEDWILPGDDPGDYIDIPFDVFVHVGKKWENWENVKTPETTGGLVRVCFNSAGKNATGSGKVKVRMTSSGRYNGTPNRCAHGVQFGDLFKIFSISSDEGWGGGHTVEYGKDYEVTIVSDGSLGPHATDDSGGRCPDSTIKLSIVDGEYGRSRRLVIGTTNNAYNNASDMEVDGGYFHSVDGNKVKYKAGPKESEGGSVEKFIITPLDVKKKEKVTFTVSSNAGDTNTFVLRAPGEPFAFSIARGGTKTVSIPFGRKDEVHILGHQGKIKFADNWRTIYFEDRPDGSDFDDLIVTCSTGRFFSQGRKLNTEYSYKYPNFKPSIDWGHDADVESQIVLTETDNWCGELKSGVDYGVRFETNSTGGGRHGGNILDGKTTGQKFAFSVGNVRGPFDDLVVTVDKGRFRSKDGTDDWGHFGHFGKGPGGSIRTDDQMLWSMPKQTNTSSKKTPDSPTGLQFTFLSADKSHKFTIRSNEIKNDKGNQKWGKGLRWTSGVQQVVKRVKVNTKYKVWASINNPLHGEKITQCEQGLIENMGRRPNEEPFAKANSTGKYIMADIIGTDNDDDDMQLGATKGTFGSSNRHRHGYSRGGSKGRWTWDLSYEVTKKIKDNQDLKGSTNSKIQTKEIFTTTGSKWITPTSSPNGQMWRINEVGDADSKSGFLNEYGVTPFNPREEVLGEAYSGTHKIVWNNVDFPMNGDYNIKVDVDDSVELVFEGPDGINVINKNGFINGKSTGSGLYREFFNKGSYKITANLTQTEGGTYSFKPLTQEQMEAARLEEFQRTQVEKPVMTSVTFNQGSSAGCTNHSSITGLFTITRNGSATKNVEIGKQYNVAISSDCGNGRVKIKIVNNGRTLKMEDANDNDYNDLVLTCSGGKFHSKNGRFCQYEGGPNVGSADEAQLEAWEANSTRSINDIALKGANPMSLAVKVSLSFVEAQKMKPQSWYQNPMGVAFTIEAPLAKPPVQKKPISEGRCPNNPFWTTRFADDADKVWYPVRNNKKEKNGETMWSEFMNKYAMSPLPPLNWTGTDFGGQWFTNEWNVNIPYDGWYIFKMLADDDARFYIKGSQKPEYGDPSLAISRYKGDPKQVRIKLFEGQGKFRVDVKNRNTTEYDHIEKKIFSARDWVGEPGASDATWEGVSDPTRFKDVDFDVSALFFFTKYKSS